MEKPYPLREIKAASVDLITQAGQKLQPYFRKDQLEERSKGGVDVVTEGDLAVDEFFKENFGELFPHLTILTEESAAKDYERLAYAEEVLIIDDIDGTVNFSRGDPHCAISIGLVRKGKSVMGVAYLPFEEGGKLYSADIESEHAMRNGEVINVSDRASLDVSSLAVDWSWDMEARERMLETLSRFVTKARQVRTLGSAVSDLCKVADGSLEAYVIDGIKPWDVAGVGIIVEKAGGTITKLDGSEWNVFDAELLATNGKLHEQMVELLR